MAVTVARVLSQVGMLSRRDALRAIRLGRVTMNGQTITDAVQKADLNDDVTLDGRPVAFTAPTPQIWKYYKPRGLITTHSDPGGRPTVFESLPRWMPRVVSVGRLDVDSEGLLLLSTSGELTGHLMHPSNGYIREYEALVVTGKERSITSAMIEQLASGLTLKSGVKFNPIETDRHLKGATRGAEWVRMRLSEGKHREVRRCWEEFGFSVGRLIRRRYGPFALDAGHEPGQLTEVSACATREIMRRLDQDRFGAEGGTKLK